MIITKYRRWANFIKIRDLSDSVLEAGSPTSKVQALVRGLFGFAMVGGHV
jgi:hypothetical protein